MAMTDIALTPQQLSFFDTFGFLHLPTLLGDAIGQITERFESVWAARGGGHHGQGHDGTRRSCIVPFIDQDAVLSGLLDDPRLHGICTSLCGDDFNYMGSDGNYYAGDTNWHSDGWHADSHLHVKIALYLDPLSRDSGALRVIPGSHRRDDRYAQDVNLHVGKAQEALGVAPRDVPAVALDNTPGDVCVFNHNTKHASFGGSGRRRMFTINLSQRYGPEQNKELRDYVAHYARFWVEKPYGEEMLRTAGPARMRHLDQLMANHDHLPALVAEAKKKMAEPSRG